MPGRIIRASSNILRIYSLKLFSSIARLISIASSLLIDHAYCRVSSVQSAPSRAVPRSRDAFCDHGMGRPSDKDSRRFVVRSFSALHKTNTHWIRKDNLCCYFGFEV